MATINTNWLTTKDNNSTHLKSVFSHVKHNFNALTSELNTENSCSLIGQIDVSIDCTN